MSRGEDPASADSAPPRAPMSDSGPGDYREFSFVSAMIVALRYGSWYSPALACRRRVAWIYLPRPPTYTSRSSFTPQSRQAPSRLTEIAAQSGLGLPAGEASHSPQFYADLLRSRYVLSAVVETKFTVRSDSEPVTRTLMDVYQVSGATDIRRERAIRRLQRAVAADLFRRTGVVTLAVSAPTASLARDINQRMLDLVNEFNTERRQLSASAERRFIETRLEDVQDGLRTAENALQRFFEENRNFENSPVLTFEQERLAREVDRQQGLYTSLSQAYEDAKINEVRDTLSLQCSSVRDVAVWPDERGMLRKGLLALIVGAGFGILVAFGVEFTRGMESDPSTNSRGSSICQERPSEIYSSPGDPCSGGSNGTASGFLSNASRNSITHPSTESGGVQSESIGLLRTRIRPTSTEATRWFPFGVRWTPSAQRKSVL